jgi:DNA-directed RNA polymerase sigma subunit (sigma70/sigma32)
MTQQIKNYRFDTRHTRLVRHLIQRYAKNQTEAVRKKLPTDERVLLMNLRSLRRPYKKIRIYTLEPSDEEILISKATIDKPKVETLVRLGIADMDTFLNREIIER